MAIIGINIDDAPYIDLLPADYDNPEVFLLVIKDGELFRQRPGDLLFTRWGMSCSSEIDPLAIGTVKSFYWPGNFQLLELMATINTAPTGATIDIQPTMDGVNLLNSALSIIEAENIAVVPPAGIGSFDPDLVDVQPGTRTEIIVSQVGSIEPGVGLTLWWGGYWKG